MITPSTLQRKIAKTVESYGSYNKAAAALKVTSTALHHAVKHGKIQPSVASALGYERIHMYTTQK